MIHSIKCRICTCRMTTVRLAQPDRGAKDLYAQKVCREFVARPISMFSGAVIFVTGEARGFAREGAYIST
jgi:hypothetical protein